MDCDRTIKVKFCIVLVLISKLVLGKELITEVVGRTNFSVLTSRQVQINTAVEYLLFGEPSFLKKNLVLNVKSKAFSSQVSRAFLEMVIYQEAKTSGIVSVPQKDLSQAHNEIKRQLNIGKRFRQWRTMQPSSQETRGIIEKKLVSRKFIQFKKRALRVSITDSESLRYFEENRSQFKGRSFMSVRDQIKSNVEKEQIKKRLDDWFAFLLKKYKTQKI